MILPEQETTIIKASKVCQKRKVEKQTWDEVEQQARFKSNKLPNGDHFDAHINQR